MRRVLALASALVLASTLGAPVPAHADDVVVVHGTDFPELGPDFPLMGLLGRTCADPTAHTSESAPIWIRYTDDPVPTGARMHGFDLQGGSAFGPTAWTWKPSTSVLTARVKVEADRAAGMLLVNYLPPTGGGHWLGSAPLALGGPGWTTLDGAGAEYTWRQYDPESGHWGPPQGPATLAAFVSTHGGDGDESAGGGGAHLGFVLGCDGNRFFYDALRVGPPGDVTTYDFEGFRTSVLIDAAPGVVTAGRPVTLTGVPEPSFTSAELTLEARAFGEEAFSPVGTATSVEEGETTAATLLRRPQVRTEYRWVLPGGQAHEGSTSAVEVVEVRRAVTARLVDRTLATGDRLVVTGTARPGAAGLRATLQRLRSGAWEDLRSVRTTAGGRYRLAQRVRAPGTWRVRVVVAAADGNLAGTSPARTARVRRG